jgi:hypothetical protein
MTSRKYLPKITIPLRSNTELHSSLDSRQLQNKHSFTLLLNEYIVPEPEALGS